MFDGAANQYPFHFLPFASQAFLDGSTAHLPWLQELPDVISTAMWSSWVEVNPATAARLGVAEGDIVEVASKHGTLRAPALVSPGIAPDLIAMPVGQGHETFTRYASGRGQNPLRILAPVTEPETGTLAWAATRVKIARVSAPAGDLILYPGTSLHHVTPVTRGARISAFFWVQSMVRDDAQRTLLFDLDSAIQQVRAALPPEHASAVQLANVYHNLLRQWADT